MGWDAGYSSRDRIVEEILDQLDCLAHRLIREKGLDVLWTVSEFGTEDHPDRIILCFLIKKFGIQRDEITSEREDVGWGYKDMSESMGPMYWSCPLEFLDMAKSADEEWRKSVRAYHIRKLRARQRKESRRHQ